VRRGERRRSSWQSWRGINFAEIDDLKNKILSFIEKNPRNDAASIAEAIGEPLVDVVSTLDLMAEEGLISLNEDGDPIGITEEGENQLGDDVGEEPVELGVVYSYEVRPDLGPEVIEGTRDFCRSLIALDRVYTRDEINQISALVGRDVWRTRGGFYHNPTSDVTTPHCRHIWFQNVVQVG
jgi:predicted transcriptional regulator